MVGKVLKDITFEEKRNARGNFVGFVSSEYGRKMIVIQKVLFLFYLKLIQIL